MDIAIISASLAAVAIVLCARLGPRWHVASPLLLVLIGIVVSFLPFVPDVELEPEIILAVVLPPLLFSSAVNMPAMNFRREFSSIGSLAVVLVLVSSVLLGLFFHWIFPNLDLAWCIALGAILSPTDAVATSIARDVGISRRVTTILEGESLLNDATALVTLRTAVAAAASAFSFWHAAGQFLWSVFIAVVIGLIAGKLGVIARARAADPALSTVLSLVVPFLAAVPTDLLDGSGLVAAVVAGIVTGRKKDRKFTPEQRISDKTMWRAATLVLEGGVFLVMGLQLRGLVHLHSEEVGGSALWQIVLIALVALLLMIVVRAAYMIPLTRQMGKKAARSQALQPRLKAMESAISDRDLRRTKELVGEQHKPFVKKVKHGIKKAKGHDVMPTEPEAAESRWNAVERRTRKVINDLDYYVRQPLTWRDGTVMVAAGMRGAVTLAAAQTLPLNTPLRSTLILIAFSVAVLSLALQGGTLAPLVRWVKPSVPDPEELRLQRQALSDALTEVTPERRDDESAIDHKLRVIVERREALLDLQDEGLYDAECTASIMVSMDASEMGLRIRQGEETDLATQEGLTQTQARAQADADARQDQWIEEGRRQPTARQVIEEADEATREAADDELLDVERERLAAEGEASLAEDATGGSAKRDGRAGD